MLKDFTLPEGHPPRLCRERFVCYCRTTSASTAPRTPLNRKRKTGERSANQGNQRAAARDQGSEARGPTPRGGDGAGEGHACVGKELAVTRVRPSVSLSLRKPEPQTSNPRIHNLNPSTPNAPPGIHRAQRYRKRWRCNATRSAACARALTSSRSTPYTLYPTPYTLDTPTKRTREGSELQVFDHPCS